MKPESNEPISIEDLLRLKRAERPPAEFWSTFDRELRAKQLAALVEKRPWWQTLPRRLTRFSRYRLPIGATAIAALAFFSVRNEDAVPTASNEAIPGQLVSVEVSDEAVQTPLNSGYSEIMTEAPAAVAHTEPNPTPVAVAVGQSQSLNDVRHQALPVEGAALADYDAVIEAPAGGLQMTPSLSAIQMSEALVSHSLLDVSHGFEVRAMPARSAIEPLQQMTPPSETRRSRLLTAMVSSASLESSPRTTARAASRIDEERLYDQIHRFGARGDRVQVKF